MPIRSRYRSEQRYAAKEVSSAWLARACDPFDTGAMLARLAAGTVLSTTSLLPVRIISDWLTPRGAL